MMTPPVTHGAPDPEELRLADRPIDARDVRALAALGRAVTWHDPPPPDLADRVRFAVAVDEMWAEVAEIQRPSRNAVAGVRSRGAAIETMTFTMGTTTVMVSLDHSHRDHVRLDGWITPAGDHHVALRVPGATHGVVAIGGRFEFDGLASGGLVQLVVTDPSSPGADPLLVTPALQVWGLDAG